MSLPSSTSIEQPQPRVHDVDVITCKAAAVAWGAGQPLVIEQVNVSPPQPMEIRIKVVCTSLCRSDLSAWESQTIFPRIFGHEATGIVESVGEGVTEFTQGDHVLTVFIGECGKCRQCASGCAVKISSLVPLEKVCLLSCGVAAGLGAAWNVADISDGSSVVIFGLGTVGLSVAQGANLRGASQIIGVDTNPEKGEKAKAFGITEFINPNDSKEPIQQVIKHLTGGGADYSFECIGDTGMVTTALQACRDFYSFHLASLLSGVCLKGWGLTVTLGVPKVKPEITAHYGAFLTGRTLKGSLFGGWKPKSDLPSLVEMYTKKEIQVDEYITHNLPFEDVNKAFNLMLEGKCLRCVIHMEN
ncbi:alcohol dehydrogenase-like 6 isoform X5 [Pyrus x bretschneideri]|uniref:alcohol dehydrogenase-like 6 isoform X5 n=1 Tax=Pyrus x bretschneideri TaxID=225117 RepID=UPI00202EB828|nr:alcohol dehydrogenase-like 6 isoform X5 [Pyrus x bretschneideri]